MTYSTKDRVRLALLDTQQDFIDFVEGVLPILLTALYILTGLVLFVVAATGLWVPFAGYLLSIPVVVFLKNLFNR